MSGRLFFKGRKSLDSRFRGNDGRFSSSPCKRGPGGFGFMFIFLFAVMALVPVHAFASEKKIVLSLDEAVRRAIKVNAEVKEAEFNVEVYRSKKQEADAARFPQIDLVAYGSLSPRARLKDGLVESSTNINKPSYDGVFGRADLLAIQPIYTFGKIDAYRKAAAHGVAAYEAGAKVKATEVAMLVKEAYWGLLLTKELKAFLADLKKQLDEATDKVRKQLDAGAPNVDQVDLFKLQTYQGEINKYIALVDENHAKALYGLRLLVGLQNSPAELEIKDEYLVPAEYHAEDFKTYEDAALKDRVEFLQLKEGLAAKEKLIEAQVADYYPQVFVAAMYSIAGATNRDHLNNPYITDDFNHAYGGAVLGFKWGFDFGIRRGKVNEAKADYLMLKMKQYYAEGGVPYQVQEAYQKLVESGREIKALSGAYHTAKQWVVASLSNFDMGVGDARDIADSVKAYARIRADYFQAVYNQRMAIANLQHATGEDAQTIPYTVSKDPLRDLNETQRELDKLKEGAK